MNINKSLVSEIKEKPIISKNGLFKMVDKHYPNIGRNYTYKIIAYIVKKGYLNKIDSNNYTTLKLQEFNYSLTNEKLDKIAKEYGDYVIWDTNILNKWLNHLLGSNVTFIEVDKGLMHFLFVALKEFGYNRILLNPNKMEFDKYFDDQLIVIKPLTKSLAERNHRITIERIIVEIYSNKYLQSLYGSDEAIEMINEIFKTLKVNIRKLYHLARRKKIFDEFHAFLLKNIDTRQLNHD